MTWNLFLGLKIHFVSLFNVVVVFCDCFALLDVRRGLRISISPAMGSARYKVEQAFELFDTACMVALNKVKF